MELTDFDFELPAEQIAQRPLASRDASSLLTLSRSSGAIRHRQFSELPELLGEGDLLVVNDARVVPARLLGRKRGTGGRAEILVVRPAAELATAEALQLPLESLEWICLGQASKGLKPGLVLEMGPDLEAEILADLGEGHCRVRFHSRRQGALGTALERAGKTPLPPYIEREVGPEDAERYQTVYAKSQGSVAAPTAGLHFTEEIFSRLASRGVRRVALTLDVGPGTFLPVRGAVETHRMHAERFDIPTETAEALAQTRLAGGRVVAVGTTVVRALESAALDAAGRIRSGPGETSLFIRPGFVFRQVDALITNFHLPRSTLLMLVCAFAGREPVLRAYREAVASGYRFFSYGDAMFIGDAR